MENAKIKDEEIITNFFPFQKCRSVVMGCQAIRSGDARIVVAGGQESMSGSAHAIHMRSGVKFGNAELKDTMLTDGLTDAFSNIHMGITAENIAKEANYR